MIYFSYNDFMDCTENGEIDKVKKLEEKTVKYEINKVARNESKNQVIDILKNKVQLKIFLNEFFNLSEIGNIQNINYCNNIKCISDKEINKNIICKIEDKEIFIFIKVIEDIDNNISYKMFEHSVNIIKKWNLEDKIENKRYPIVIPIVIYIGEKIWNKSNNKLHNNINYIKFQNNSINFSYNMINIHNLKITDLNKMNSEISNELINIKNKYLQIN